MRGRHRPQLLLFFLFVCFVGEEMQGRINSLGLVTLNNVSGFGIKGLVSCH